MRTGTILCRGGSPHIVPLTLVPFVADRRLVVISDYQGGSAYGSPAPSVEAFRAQQKNRRRRVSTQALQPREVKVEGGYIERLPLACLRTGLTDSVEVWTHWRGDDRPMDRVTDHGHIIRRAFRMNGPDAPFASNDMLAYVQEFGAPEILCVWGLGVCEEIMMACQSSLKIYNSIDAPALRIPPEISRHFDLVLTGAQWQSEVVRERHPHMKTAILPIGPEFASDTLFYPRGEEKSYDLVYVAAAQPYKRHDILFDALAALPRSIRALCVMGYGEMGDALRKMAGALGIDVNFIGPPGVPIAEVNRLMNQAKIGVVCGVDDGAPAILTEYMLAGLPVLANNKLVCGLQYINPRSGCSADAKDFPGTIVRMLENLSDFSPRDQVTANWTWEHSVQKLRELILS